MHHQDTVGAHDSLDSVGDGDHCGLFKAFPDCLLDESVGLGIDIGCCLIDEDQSAVSEDGSGDTDELFLSD